MRQFQIFRAREVIGDLAHITASIVGDLKAWPNDITRLIDEIEAVLSVLAAIELAHHVGARNVGWAAFSGYMVMRSHVSLSFKRGSLRVLGTAAGAGFAWLLAIYIMNIPVWLSIALGTGGFVTLYFALISRHSYAWLFAGITFAMVLIDGMEHPHEALELFAESRFIEVLAGTVSAVVISAVSTLTIRRKLHDPQREMASQAAVRSFAIWNQAAILHALQGAIALGLIPWIWAWLDITSLSQSSTTIMAVMMVPVASLSIPKHPTTSKLIHRFIGCLIGGLLATACMLLSHSWPIAMTIGVCVGVMFGRHIENGPLGIGYIGTQFALAFLVVLVPDSYAKIDVGSGFDRLAGILGGMLLLEPVRFAFRVGSRLV